MEKRQFKWIIYLAILAFLGALAVSGIHRAFINHTRTTYNNAVKLAPFDVIIVPGIPYDSTHSNYMLSIRLHWAVALYQRGITKNIIFSGAAVHTAYTESKIMSAMADSLGIPAEHLFCETKAEHSIQNVYLGWQLANQLGLKKMALATDAFQAYFLKDFMKQQASGMVQLPLVPDSFNFYAKALPKINTKEALAEHFIPLEQRESVWQRFRHSYLFK